MAWLRSFYAGAQNQARMLKLPMPSFDEFWRRGYVEFPVPEESAGYTTFADFRADPAMHALGTASGRIEIFCEPIAKMGYSDCPGHPTWIEPIGVMRTGTPLILAGLLFLGEHHPRLLRYAAAFEGVLLLLLIYLLPTL